MLSAQQIALSRGQKLLFSNADFVFYQGDKVGIVGKNGSGKSSLFALIQKKLSIDAGILNVPGHLKISFLAQHIPDSDECALDFVLGGDTQYIFWQQALSKAIEIDNHDDILKCHEHLQDMDAYSKPSVAARILHGLGFSHKEQSHSVKSFSGGWRMRLGLARCLMNPAELYLLDEPTNHLDLEAIFWLEKWLKELDAMVIVISHDRDFLDATVGKILHLDNQTFKIYTGNYSFFETARAMYLQQQTEAFNKQQSQIKHLMSYVDRFKAQATKAKQAQSRLKAIDRMEIIALAHIDNPFSFEFLKTKPVGHHLIKCKHLDVGYANCDPLIYDIQLMVHGQDRIGLLGPNGQGKSSFIKTLVGEIPPMYGEIMYAKDVSIGYFAQHQIEQLDMQLSPIQTIQEIDKKASEQSIRNFLGGFHFIGDMATHSIEAFSGGEKARLALAKLVWTKPHLLLLDEPTNHLDLDMRSAIEIALQSYEGAVILISHDRHLINSTVNDFYLIYDGKMEVFDGDLDDYYQWLNKKDSSSNQVESKVVTKTKNTKETYKLQKQLKQIEQTIQKRQEKLITLEQELQNEASHKLQKELKDELEQLETNWLELTTLIENSN
jgi:ATP-binding cassette subfamily F protein 3